MTSDTINQASKLKEITRSSWDDAAVGWDRHAPKIRDWLQVPTRAMLEMARISSGHTVLDLAAGAGDQTLDLAKRVGPSGSVIASDISPAILARAHAAALKAGVQNVKTCLADAENLGLEAETFDAAVCRLGLMFLPNPLQGLKQVHRVLKPGARFCSMVFAGPERNPCLRVLMSTALRHAGLPPRDPFQPGGLVSLGRSGDIDALFTQAGFTDVATISMDAPFCLPSTEHYLTFIREAAGPIIQILAALDEDAQQAAWADITAQLNAFQTDNAWVGPNTLLLTVGRK